MSDPAPDPPVSTRSSAPPRHGRPRVLHIYKDYYPPVMGGVEATINILAEGCRDEFDTAVLVNSGSRESFHETINGVSVTRVGEWGRFASAPFSPAFVNAMRREAARADILHFHHPNPTGDLARFLTRPIAAAVMTYHSDVVRQQRAMAVYGPLQNWQMTHCDVIMPTSPNYMESSPWLQRHRDRCRVVPLGIPMQPLESTPAVARRAAELRAQFPGEKLTLFVGRLRYYKGLEYLLKAAPHFHGQIILAGTGPMAADLAALAGELGIGGRVHFLGDVPEQEKIAWYHAADVFCLPSHLRSEAFGLSQLEAMACGTPVVCCDVPSGVPFVNKNGESGLVVPTENPEALGAALQQILSDDALRERLGAGAFARARREFTAEKMCERVKDVYRTVLKK